MLRTISHLSDSSPSKFWPELNPECHLGHYQWHCHFRGLELSKHDIMVTLPHQLYTALVKFQQVCSILRPHTSLASADDLPQGNKCYDCSYLSLQLSRVTLTLSFHPLRQQISEVLFTLDSVLSISPVFIGDCVSDLKS